MKLSTRIRYGCRAMVNLAATSADGPVTLAELARSQHMPRRYLANIVQDLRKSGLIRSVRGAHGGYMLSARPSQVSVLDIWEALEGPLSPAECLRDPDCCQMLDGCVTRDVWSKMTVALHKVLKSVTLAELARKSNAKAGKTAT